MNPTTHTCICGFTWQHGRDGSHHCGPYYQKTITELRAALAQKEACRDWTEDFTHENGNYQNHCYTCKQVFNGHKHRRICKVCSDAFEVAQKEAAAPGDERAAFEHSMNSARFFPAELNFAQTKSPSGRDEYANSHLESCWVGWQARAALAQPVAVDAPQGWVSMADRMPPNGESVLIFYPQDVAEPYRIDMWDEWHEDPIGMGGPTVCVGEGFMSYGDDEITHWMPLPAPPVAAIDAQDKGAT